MKNVKRSAAKVLGKKVVELARGQLGQVAAAGGTLLSSGNSSLQDGVCSKLLQDGVCYPGTLVITR